MRYLQFVRRASSRVSCCKTRQFVGPSTARNCRLLNLEHLIYVCHVTARSLALGSFWVECKSVAPLWCENERANCARKLFWQWFKRTVLCGTEMMPDSTITLSRHALASFIVHQVHAEKGLAFFRNRNIPVAGEMC